MVHRYAPQRVSGAKQEMNYPAAHGGSGYALQHRIAHVDPKVIQLPNHGPILHQLPLVAMEWFKGGLLLLAISTSYYRNGYLRLYALGGK